MPAPSLPEHPGGLGPEGILLIAGTLMAIAPGWVFVPVLKILGFGKNGIVAGSLAAKIQSFIRIVFSLSVFAVFQSAGMGGYGAAILAGIVKVAGFLTVAIGAVLAALSKWKP